MTAADYAEILDPERKVEGWWDTAHRCSVCGMELDGPPRKDFKCYYNVSHLDGGEDAEVLTPSLDYIGRPDLHTARSEAWRGEEWLVQKSDDNTRYRVCITKTGTDVQIRRKFCDFENIYSNKDHAAAIAEAVRRVNDGQK